MNPIKQAEQFFNLKAQWLGAGGHPVGPSQSQGRADVCLACPHNVERPLEEMFKGYVALTVKRQVQLKNQMQLRVNGEKRLHICERCECVLKLKVHVPLEFILKHTKIEGLPAHCWVIQESKPKP